MKKACYLLFLVFFPVLVFSQNAAGEVKDPSSSIIISSAFNGISLGDSLQSVQDTLKTSSYFSYRGEKDVSFLPKKPEVLIDCEGRYFVRRGLFQFQNEKLFTFIVMLDTARLDYYTLFTRLSQKYGNPLRLDPKNAVWEDGKTRLSLEKPLSVKYIDLNAFKERNDAAVSEKSIEEISRDKFLDLF